MKNKIAQASESDGDLDIQNLHIPIEIEEVMELQGAFISHGVNAHYRVPLYAHVAKPVRDNGVEKRYVLLAHFPRHGMAGLGDIDSESKRFLEFRPEVIAHYKRASNRVIYEMSVPASELSRLKTIDDVLAVPGIQIAHRNKPQL